QAEDGIRDLIVTGVQTCALPIYREAQTTLADAVQEVVGGTAGVGPHQDRQLGRAGRQLGERLVQHLQVVAGGVRSRVARPQLAEIGRASCRERVESSVRAGASRQ